MGWELWQGYFERNYGKDWKARRRGRRGMCSYCSGREATRISLELSRHSKQFNDPSCLTGKEKK